MVKVRILGMVPDNDMNAIVSSAAFQSDSWSAFSSADSTYVCTWEGDTMFVGWT